MKEFKILFTGTVGAGKTTAIAAISETDPIRTEVKNNDPSSTKEFTTVGFDYGEVQLSASERLRLYGTPGQDRFSFMWKILSKGALGLIILIDNSRPSPLRDLSTYLESFKDLIKETACVIGVGRTETSQSPSIDDYSEHLANTNQIIPVVPIDVRQEAQVRSLLDLLLLQLECRSDARGST